MSHQQDKRGGGGAVSQRAWIYKPPAAALAVMPPPPAPLTRWDCKHHGAWGVVACPKIKNFPKGFPGAHNFPY